MSVLIKTLPLLMILLQLHTPARGQEAALSDDAHPAPIKLHIHHGGIDDVEAIGHRKLGKVLDWYPIDKEIDLGEREAQEFERSYTVLQDPLASEYIDHVGQKLVLNSDATVPLTFKIIDSDEINCFALPGGYVYVTSASIVAADNEAELAGVIAVGIAHIAARHGTRMLTAIDIANLMSPPVISNGGSVMSSYAQVRTIGPAMTFLRFSRDFAKEADYLAIQYMYKAGYAPSGFVTFLEKLKAREITPVTKTSVAFATHPPAAARIESAQKEIARMLPPRAHSMVNTPEFDRIKKALEDRAATDRENGSEVLLRRRLPTHP